MIDERAAQLVMMNVKNRVHKAIRTAKSLQSKSIPPPVTTPPLAPATRQPREVRYQTYAAVEAAEPDDDGRLKIKEMTTATKRSMARRETTMISVSLSKSRQS